MDSSTIRPPIGISDWYAQKYGTFNEDDRTAYLKNPLAVSHAEKGDFTPFYVTITIFTIFGFALIVLNVFLCYCSKHRYYWQDPNTGNRWVLPIWTQTPFKQPPLDLTELEDVAADYPSRLPADSEYLELHKRESDL
ncbi:unnamed protein product [Nesidiocoris tenuis]|uniref:Uncharacterized protein n=1 Tax=Nesidiocoris tenuis TaxID=355587 RepID=A0A6H5G6K7_9HEMI|nr:unnamed protein product [Nesidiocoris tenuis]CAA9998468.1 unnamed protein product [Nesidiocoris tenuis]